MIPPRRVESRVGGHDGALAIDRRQWPLSDQLVCGEILAHQTPGPSGLGDGLVATRQQSRRGVGADDTVKGQLAAAGSLQEESMPSRWDLTKTCEGPGVTATS